MFDIKSLVSNVEADIIAGAILLLIQYSLPGIMKSIKLIIKNPKKRLIDVLITNLKKYKDFLLMLFHLLVVLFEFVAICDIIYSSPCNITKFKLITLGFYSWVFFTYLMLLLKDLFGLVLLIIFNLIVSEVKRVIKKNRSAP
jgi:hypothetical protein